MGCAENQVYAGTDVDAEEESGSPSHSSQGLSRGMLLLSCVSPVCTDLCIVYEEAAR